MERKFIITGDEDRVQQFLEEGWRIVSVTSQHVATGSTGQYLYGKFAILLERERPLTSLG